MEDRELWEKRIGTTLRGKWKLERLLGVGGMAAVYVGYYPLMARHAAIKVLHPEFARSPDLRARFEQEARVLSTFRHPGAVEVIDMDTSEDGAPFLVMELLEGEPLGERAKRLDGLPSDEMLRYVDEVLEVLVAAHKLGIVHRDIKLDNVFVTKSGRSKVLDFGIARITGDQQAVRTRLGAMLGTLPYMPPEQIKGQDIDGRVDLFAVGAMMFRLLTRRRIHEASTDAEMLVKMSTEPAPPVGTLAKDAPIGLCMVVDRALAFRKERRYPDAQTMQADVRAVMRGEQPPHAAERLAAGDAPNALIPTTTPSHAFVDAPTALATPADMFRDKPTAATGMGLGPNRASTPFTDGPTALPTSEMALPASMPARSTSPSGAAWEPSPTGAQMAFQPTVMASAQSMPMPMPATPTRTPAPSVPTAPAGATPLAVAITPPAITPPTGSSAPIPTGPVAAATPAVGTPGPVVPAAAPNKPAEPRKLPLVPMIAGGVVAVVLLFVAIAVLAGRDDDTVPSSASGASSAAPNSQESTSPSDAKPSSTRPRGSRFKSPRWQNGN